MPDNDIPRYIHSGAEVQVNYEEFRGIFTQKNLPWHILYYYKLLGWGVKSGDACAPASLAPMHTGGLYYERSAI